MVLDYQIADNAVYSDGRPVTCDDMVLAWAAQSGRFPGFDAASQAGYLDIAGIECQSGAKKARVNYFPDRSVADYAQLFGATAMMPSHVIGDVLGLDVNAALQSGDPVAAARIADAWNRATVRRFDRVIATTNFAREEIDRIGWTKVSTVPLGVDLDQFHPHRWNADVRMTHCREGVDALVVMCSRLSKEKRPDLAIDAIRRLHSYGFRAKLVVVGSGPMEEQLRRRAADLPVTWLGFVSDREVLAQLLATADVVIAPGPIETFGLAALEALASGTPVVASNTSAVGEIIGSRGGRVVAPDATSMAAGILEVISTAEPARRAAARSRAEQFPWHKTVHEMLRIHGLTHGSVPTQVVA
jgi:glycosyltransferase involved in cell wall biosynthesis